MLKEQIDSTLKATRSMVLKQDVDFVKVVFGKHHRNYLKARSWKASQPLELVHAVGLNYSWEWI